MRPPTSGVLAMALRQAGGGGSSSCQWPDLIHGTTINTKGMGLSFSRLNFGKRWMVEPIGGGAYRYAPGKGWAVVVDAIC